jgi:isocitrate dehydrogenase kinase/phosphatase
MLGQIGGVIGIIFPLGALISQYFTEKIYQMTLLSKLYQIENNEDRKGRMAEIDQRLDEAFGEARKDQKLFNEEEKLDSQVRNS